MQPQSKVNVLLIGSGGREHALAWKLAQSHRLRTLYTDSPQNPGIAALATPVDVPIDARNPFRAQRFCDQHDISLIVIGPEDPLAAGLTDVLRTPTRHVFGPSQAAAQLEANKAWCKSLLRAASIPLAEGKTFTDPERAKAFLTSRDEPYVVKASGLAKGKGVIVPETIEEAIAAVDLIMTNRAFGDAGNEIVVEEKLEGSEVSVLAFVDGRNIYVLEPSQDHKRLLNNDNGPNTGGMGVFSPGGCTDNETLSLIERDILVPTIDALRREGIDYTGVLYAGIMLTPAGPKILEYNVRFGDPECQALMVRFDADLVDVMLATCTRRLDDVQINWSPSASCCVTLASAGYPNDYKKHLPITGIDDANAVPGVTVFHAGTTRTPDGSIVTTGGRVLSVTAAADSLTQARERAYRACDLIQFEGKTYRTDIAAGATLPINS